MTCLPGGGGTQVSEVTRLALAAFIFNLTTPGSRGEISRVSWRAFKMQHERKPFVKKGLIYEKEAKVQTLGEIFIKLVK